MRLSDNRLILLPQRALCWPPLTLLSPHKPLGKAQKTLVDPQHLLLIRVSFIPAHDNEMKNTNGTNNPGCVLFLSTCVNTLVDLLSCEIFKTGHPSVLHGPGKKGSSWAGVSRGDGCPVIVSGLGHLLWLELGASLGDWESSCRKHVQEDPRIFSIILRSSSRKCQ